MTSIDRALFEFEAAWPHIQAQAAVQFPNVELDRGLSLYLFGVGYLAGREQDNYQMHKAELLLKSWLKDGEKANPKKAKMTREFLGG